MSLRYLKSAMVVAMLACSQQTGVAAEAGSCLESSRALRNYKSTYTWCPDGWKETQEGGEVTFSCKATGSVRRCKRPGPAGGESLRIRGDKDSKDKCR